MSKFTIPSHFKELYSKEDIAKEIARLGTELKPWITKAHEETKKEVIAICMLRGALFFFADLLREVGESVEIEFCKLNTYDTETNSKLPENKIPNLVLPCDVNGRAILLVDDICETGHLLHLITETLKSAGASEIKTAVMIYRDTPESLFTPDYQCFNLGTMEWTVGMGLDDKGSWRNLPFVCIMNS